LYVANIPIFYINHGVMFGFQRSDEILGSGMILRAGTKKPASSRLF
jgi:hypothetical protein